MFYKNTSYTAKTFYGVTFKPGEIKEVTGNINNRWMIKVDAPQVKIQQKPSSEKPKDEPAKLANTQVNKSKSAGAAENNSSGLTESASIEKADSKS